ncbi:hypothetical protein [Kitasatospora sp. NBC_01302]|uniref:hypothetical protein n=1 Tax=Kitasatospora sp. NBC_01302 TaxID=2903575 RepID=UPI002E157852|nr:hypothetical protein OG294_24710 [Kitasatospora sp. NBC_01302]
MSSMHMPWYARVVFTAGRPFVLVAALVMSVPGEIRMAQIAGWHGWVTWLMPVSVSVYAGAAAVISEHRRHIKAPGRASATIGAGAALGLALAAQVMAHLFDKGYIATSGFLVAAVSAVPPLVVAHMLHMAATPEAELSAAERIHELEVLLDVMANEVAEALDREGRELVSLAAGIANGLDELAEEAADLADELEADLAEPDPADTAPKRQTRQAIPLTEVHAAVAAIRADKERRLTGPALASELGCSTRSGYRYLRLATAA